ncbi:Sodium-dependent dicarboxylate transporter SdcS [Planctomycetes bacterium Poly30]|uniref:Sodium-dependent dicarboxylate transporter SdcS n=1 Tax=Saltatorellus ferox TaxID=2528018 RepID=A0A518EP07_9BACT|nr:Sodium-dependent dicarboxylate transporter SdcS [Planctomycetes bacterium Poly30]
MGALFIVAAGVRETGVIDAIARGALGSPRTLRSALLRIMIPVIGFSAFLNNTPVVAMLIPAVRDWARKLGIAPSKLMLPLSYAAILGGTCTLIGTSTNLVVSGLVEQQTSLGRLGIFDIAWLGVPCALVGAAFVIFAGPKLLPDRGSATSSLHDVREYTAEMMVPEGSPLMGRTVEGAGLRSLPRAYLVEIEREGHLIMAPGPTQLLREGDRLVFTGVVESIKELQTVRGLLPATNQIFKLDEARHNRSLVEAVVSTTSPLVGRTVKIARFRTLYNAVIIAVARNGERVRGQVGEIVMQPGDTLLLEARSQFVEHHRNNRDFFLVSQLEDSSSRRHQHATSAILIIAAMVLASATGVLSMLHASMLAAGLMLIARCTSVQAARDSVDWSALLVIASAFGIGTAIEKSGLASVAVEGLMGVAGGSPLAVLAAMYLVTTVLTELISNNAAVALVFPVAIGSAERLGVHLEPFIYSLMMAGSASFCTPIGYQTNMMVMGPGGYRFADYLRIGAPLNLGLGVITIVLAPLIWPF